MKRLLALFCLALLLGGCVAVPYDADSVYYPTTVSAQVSSGYYYPNRTYPYTPAPYSRPYPYNYPYYQPYQPPAYFPPAPVIVPPPRLPPHRNTLPGWQNHPHPHPDALRNGPQPEWNHHDGSRPHWQHRNDGRRDWQGRDGGREDWRRDGGHDWRHDGRRGYFRSQ